MAENQAEIICYGTRWCPDCWRARWLLDQYQIPYKWIDIDRDPEARAYVQQINGGYRSVPTIVFPDGSILVEPSHAELAEKLSLST
jgi:glutaredoxin-like protein